ncbi:hypothetical protein BGX28_008741 [Mortierella sp. GBA30]|nr:hypothetical protein BGX28_008741 [Mortierella sp. GBA30]
MASLRAIGVLLLLLSITCSTVYSMKPVALIVLEDPSADIKRPDDSSVFDKGYALLDRLPPLSLPLMQPDGVKDIPLSSPANIIKQKDESPNPGIIRAQSSFQDFFSDNYNYIQTPLTWQRAISGGVLLVVGLVLGIAAYAILVNTEPEGLWANRILIYVAVCIAAGLLIGLLLLTLNKFASWILGGAGGLALGVYILSWKEGGLIHNTVGRICLMAGAAALGMFLSLLLGSLTVIFATVLIGGYMFTLGLDMFLRTGFLENYKNLFQTGSSVPYQIYSGIYGMLGVLSFMFLLGFLVQIPLYFHQKRKQRRLARANAMPPVNGPYGGYYRDSQYGSHWGSQYGSRDHLTGAYSQPMPEYTWWGKRKNRDSHLGYPQGHGYSEKGYQNVPTSQSRSAINLNQPQYSSHAGKAVDRGQQDMAPKSEFATTSAAPLATAPTTGDKAVTPEKKKTWYGRTKKVPKVVDKSKVDNTLPPSATPGTASSTGPADTTVPSTTADTRATSIHFPPQ